MKLPKVKITTLNSIRLALILYLLFILISNFKFKFMTINVFLAYVPFELAFLLTKLKKSSCSSFHFSSLGFYFTQMLNIY